MGGYKSALNVDFLLASNVKLVVNAAPGLVRVFGPKYAERRKRAWARLEEDQVREVRLDWIDSPTQKLPWKEIGNVVEDIDVCLQKGTLFLS